MKVWKDRFFLGALPGVELDLADWKSEAATYALVVSLVPEDEIAEKAPEYFRAKRANGLPLIQEAPLPPQGIPTQERLRAFWEMAFVAKSCTACADVAFAFDDGHGERVAMFCLAVLMQYGYTFDTARAETADMGLHVFDRNHLDILRHEQGLPKALRVSRP